MNKKKPDEDPKPIGRPRLDTTVPVSEMIKVFMKEPTLEAAADKLGISSRSLKRYLIAARVPARKPRHEMDYRSPGPPPWTTVFKGPIHSWFAQNPENKIHSTVELAKIIGTTRSRVGDYLYRKRLALELFLATLGNLAEVPVKLVDIRGREIICRFITDYRLKVDPISYQVTVRGAFAKAGPFTAKVGFKEYCSMFGRRVDPRSFFKGEKV